MRIKVRIYNPYDLDIIALSEAKGFSVANAMKQTLIYYAAGKRYLVEIPALTEVLDDDRYVKGFYIELDDKEDARAVEFIKSIPAGYRNAFLKNIFRASFEVSPMSLYMGPGGAEYVAKMIANPRYGRHPVQREIVDPFYLGENEVGVIISSERTNAASMPRGESAGSPSQKRARSKTAAQATVEQPAKTPAPTQGRARQTPYGAVRDKKQRVQHKPTEKENKYKAASQEETDDMDALLDAMM